MIFAAYFWENTILLLSRMGHIHPIFKAHRGVGPIVGHLQLFQKKTTNAQGGNWLIDDVLFLVALLNSILATFPQSETPSLSVNDKIRQ